MTPRPMPIPLPSVDECLFGHSRKCPKMNRNDNGNGNDNGNDNDNLPLNAKKEGEKEDSEPEGATNTEHATGTIDDASDHSSISFNDDDGIGGDGGVGDDDGGSRPSIRVSGMYDSFHLGHWGEAAQQHDINLVQLRKICSQGIADEGSHRGVAWRVLLGYLPPKNIVPTWPSELPPQRTLYEQLVQEYFGVYNKERGPELRGQLSKRLQRDRKLRQKYDRMQRLDESYQNDASLDGHQDDGNEDKGNGNDDSGNDNDNDEGEEEDQGSHAQSPASTTDNTNANANANENENEAIGKIQDSLPLKFQEQWKRSGINLDRGMDHLVSPATSYSTAMALGRNHLVVPKLDDTMQEEFLIFVEDAQLLEEIRKDVTRTHPDLFFYLEPKDNLGLRRYGALERILFIWSKLNRGVRYVQGMNEIVGTIYYVLANDHNSDWADYAEADTYFLFHTLIMEMRDVFVPDMDTESTGIQGRIGNMQRLLRTHDPEVQEHLEECGIDASFFAIRWLTTLLSREFLLPDTIRLWDSMFASTHKENFLRYVCGTMVMMVRDELLKGDFSSCLRLLQSYPPANVDQILESSRSLWIYESQITVACHKGGISLHQALQTVSPPPAIIMAFGLRNGVAPNLHDRLETAKHQAQEKVHSATEGLMGRAQRIWSGWGTPTPNTVETTAAAIPASRIVLPSVAAPSPTAANTPSKSTFPPPTPPRSRFWNRSRSNTNESASSLPGSTAVIQEESIVATTPTPTTALPSTPASMFTNHPNNATVNGSDSGTPNSAISTRRPIWNRSPAATRTPTSTPQQNPEELSITETAPSLPVLASSATTAGIAAGADAGAGAGATRRPIWNRGGISASTQSPTTQGAAPSTPTPTSSSVTPATASASTETKSDSVPVI